MGDGRGITTVGMVANTTIGVKVGIEVVPEIVIGTTVTEAVLEIVTIVSISVKVTEVIPGIVGFMERVVTVTVTVVLGITIVSMRVGTGMTMRTEVGTETEGTVKSMMATKGTSLVTVPKVGTHQLVLMPGFTQLQVWFSSLKEIRRRREGVEIRLQAVKGMPVGAVSLGLL